MAHFRLNRSARKFLVSAVAPHAVNAKMKREEKESKEEVKAAIKAEAAYLSRKNALTPLQEAVQKAIQDQKTMRVVRVESAGAAIYVTGTALREAKRAKLGKAKLEN